MVKDLGRSNSVSLLEVLTKLFVGPHPEFQQMLAPVRHIPQRVLSRIGPLPVGRLSQRTPDGICSPDLTLGTRHNMHTSQLWLLKLVLSMTLAFTALTGCVADSSHTAPSPSGASPSQSTGTPPTARLHTGTGSGTLSPTHRCPLHFCRHCGIAHHRPDPTRRYTRAICCV